MNPLRTLALVAFTLLAPAALGCSGDVSDAPAPGSDTDPGASEDEIKRGGLLGEVGAVKVNGGATVAAPAKIKRILENIGLQPGAAKPKEGGFRCMPSYRLEFLKPSGEPAGTAGFMCGGPGSPDRKDAKGSVQVNGKSYLINARDIDGIDEVAKEPLAVGDVLFGADKIEIGKPGATTTKVASKDGAIVAKVIKAMKADEVPDPHVSFPRCLPSRYVSFHKGAKELASISLTCSENATGQVQGSFSVREPQLHGGVQIDAGVVFSVERSLAAN